MFLPFAKIQIMSRTYLNDDKFISISLRSIDNFLFTDNESLKQMF